MSWIRWVVATGNRGKFTEIRALLEGAGLELVAQGELGIEGAPETASSFVENALMKARHAARHSGLPAIADDSGLAVAALGGAPGIYSARYAGAAANAERNIAKLLDAMRKTPAAERDARFHCVAVALRGPEDPLPLIAHGSWRGAITEQPAGLGGFGYDPVFFDPLLGRTAAELPAALKNGVSHRAVAFRALARRLREERSAP